MSRLRGLAWVLLERGRACVLLAVRRPNLMIMTDGRGLAGRRRLIGRWVEHLALAACWPAFVSLRHAAWVPVALLRGHPVHAGPRAVRGAREDVVAISWTSIDPVAVARIAVRGAVVRDGAVRTYAILDIGRGNRPYRSAHILQAAQ